jgi:hypothetical protein
MCKRLQASFGGRLSSVRVTTQRAETACFAGDFSFAGPHTPFSTEISPKHKMQAIAENA